MQSKYTPKCENLLHQNFNHLTAIGYAGHNKRSRVQWLWKCECGRLKIIDAAKVKTGHTISCGCKGSRNTIGQRSQTHKLSRTPEYRVWGGMKNRCYGINNPQYADWGGRGIIVCERWRTSFENFLVDMGKRPSPQHTIERKDNDGPYTPENCIWVLRAIQNANTRKNRHLTLNGVTHHMAEWARITGINSVVICMRLKAGWPVERALTTSLKIT